MMLSMPVSFPLLARTAVLLLAAVFAVVPVRAAVDVAPTGFVVRHQVTVNAAPAKVYDALVGQVGAWWNPDHTYSHDSRNLSIDARPGGCFCERFPGGGGVEHMRVIYLAPNSTLRLAGALGPLAASGLTGSLTWTLKAEGAATKLELGYSVGGFMAGGFEKMAPAVDGMLLETIGRLRLFVETGSPTPR